MSKRPTAKSWVGDYEEFEDPREIAPKTQAVMNRLRDDLRTPIALQNASQMSVTAQHTQELQKSLRALTVYGATEARKLPEGRTLRGAGQIWGIPQGTVWNWERVLTDENPTDQAEAGE